MITGSTAGKGLKEAVKLLDHNQGRRGRKRGEGGQKNGSTDNKIQKSKGKEGKGGSSISLLAKVFVSF